MNKLKSTHINFYRNKMNLSLAVQVLSHYVAQALSYIITLNLSQFYGCETIYNSKNQIAKGSKAVK